MKLRLLMVSLMALILLTSLSFVGPSSLAERYATSDQNQATQSQIEESPTIDFYTKIYDESRLAAGYYVLGPRKGRGDAVNTGAFLLDVNGSKVITVESDSFAIDLRETPDSYAPYVMGRGSGVGGIVHLDRNFKPVYWADTKGIVMDGHDFAYTGHSHIFGTYGRNEDSDVPWYFALEEVNKFGAITWTWVATDHMDIGDMTGDWHHWNSLYIHQDSIIMSLRGQSSVISIAYPSGNIEWQFGGESLGDYPMIELTAGDSFCRQHDVRLSGNLLTVFDNACNEDFSRAVDYEIDYSNMTASQVFEYKGPFARATGGYKILSNGNRLISWGTKPGDATGESARHALSELSPNGDLLLELFFSEPGYMSYRSNKILPVSLGKSSYVPFLIRK